MRQAKILRAPEGVVSLLDQTLIAATQNLSSIGAVLNFCATNETQNNSCSKAVELWKRTIARIVDPYVVLQRQDLRDEDWYEFAKLLAVGVEYKYCVRHDMFNSTWSANALPYAGVREDKALIPQDIYYFKFTIPAAIPRSGTTGYFLRMTIDNTIPPVKEIGNFVAGSDMHRNFIIAAQILGEAYWNYHYNKLHIKRDADFVPDDANYHDDIGTRNPLPNKEFFTDRIIGVGLDPATGIGHDVIWFLYHGDDAHGGSYMTESYYEIVPITF